MRFCLVLAALAAVSGCAHSRTSSFPDQHALESLAAEAPAAPPLHEGVHEVTEWQAEGPFPAPGEGTPARLASRWSAALDAQASRTPGTLEPAGEMDCLAREVGRFYLAHGQLPPEGVSRFLAGRCGAHVLAPSFRWWHGEVPETVSEETLHAQWKQGWEDTVASVAKAGGRRAVGVWFGRNATRAVALVASGERKVRLLPGGLAVDAAGAVQVRGELLVPLARLDARVNVGAYGVRPCTPDTSVALPRFAFVCPADRADANAWVEVVGFETGRYLGSAVLQALVSPSGTPSDHYVRMPVTPAPATGDALARARAFTAALNTLRTQLQLSPLVLAERQSGTATRVAPHFFAASAGLAPLQRADMVALGLQAGWEVEGTIREGRFAAAWTGPQDASALLTSMLEMPSHRSVLLAPEAHQLAAGLLPLGEKEGMGAVVTTYSFFAPEHLAQVREAVRAKLARARQEKGTAPALAVPGGAEALARALEQVRRGQAYPEQALRDVLEEVSTRSGLAVGGWRLEVGRLEDVTFPDALLQAQAKGVEVDVTFYKPADEPWGRYLLLFVTASGAASERYALRR